MTLHAGGSSAVALVGLDPKSRPNPSFKNTKRGRSDKKCKLMILTGFYVFKFRLVAAWVGLLSCIRAGAHLIVIDFCGFAAFGEHFFFL